MACYDEVDATDVGDGATVSALAKWAAVHKPLVNLYVDGDARADWAKDQLRRFDSAVNQSARELLEQLNRWQPCFYWLGIAGPPDEGRCPWCSVLLTVDVVGPMTVFKCDSCKIVLPIDSPASRLTSA